MKRVKMPLVTILPTKIKTPIFLTCRGAKKSENATFSLFPGLVADCSLAR